MIGGHVQAQGCWHAQELAGQALHSCSWKNPAALSKQEVKAQAELSATGLHAEGMAQHVCKTPSKGWEAYWLRPLKKSLSSY